MASNSRRPPPPKQTIEVDVSWLEAMEGAPETPVMPPRKRKLPPPMPGGGHLKPPPMPVEPRPSGPPARRETMEVKAEWLETVLPKRSRTRSSIVPPSPEASGAPATTRSRTTGTPPPDEAPKKPRSRASLAPPPVETVVAKKPRSRTSLAPPPIAPPPAPLPPEPTPPSASIVKKKPLKRPVIPRED